MSKTLWSLSIFASVLVLGLGLTPAQALNTRSFISAFGNDANPCTRTAPCRTLQKAHDSTSANGEINMLDPAGYGTVTITKSISIVNDGVGSAGVLVPLNGTGITINAGFANDRINLRGLIIEGAGVGDNGIVFNTGGSLTIENCVIRYLTGDGIRFVPNASSRLAVSNTLVAHNFLSGIVIEPSGSGAVTAVFNRVEAYSNLWGIAVRGTSSTGTINATVTDSVAANGGGRGIESVSSTGHATTSVMVVHSVSANNLVGLAADGSPATLRVSQSTVTGNAFGWQVFSGTLLSAADNTIEGNANNQGAPPTYALK